MEVRRPGFLCWFCCFLAHIPRQAVTGLDGSCKMRWRDPEAISKFWVSSSFLRRTAEKVLLPNISDTLLKSKHNLETTEAKKREGGGREGEMVGSEKPKTG